MSFQNREQDSSALSTVLRDTGMWRASTIDWVAKPGTPSGFPVLDQHLPGGGWPTDGITELLYDQEGIGEIRLLIPALAHLSQVETRWLLWVSPPYVPYAPALSDCGVDLSRILLVKPEKPEDILWVLEKALASQSCSAVLAWPGQIRDKEIRRLQVASKEGRCLGILFRKDRASRQASPAELRIQLCGASAPPLTEHSIVKLRILKRRGGWATEFLTVDFDDRLNQVTPDFADMVVTNSPGQDNQPVYPSTSLPRNRYHDHESS
ncbi:MAG: translesion DNA synthesis-associated protein ImuA [Pseudomonadales bacterium]